MGDLHLRLILIDMLVIKLALDWALKFGSVSHCVTIIVFEFRVGQGPAVDDTPLKIAFASSNNDVAAKAALRSA